MATVLDAENTPLVQNSDVYTRFRERTKILIVAQISVCGLLPMFSAESFVPSIPQIARDLETTGAVVNLAVSLSIFTASTGALVWSRYSSFYGRRPIYLYSLPVFAIGSLGTACVRSAPALMFWRVVQAFGASGGFVVGVGVIADVYRLEERGRAMGIFLAAVLLAAPVAPPVGGFVARYYSWRTMQLGLCGAAVLIFVFMLIWMPETSQPGARGIDKIEEGKSKIVVLNPFKELRLLRGLNVLAMCIIATGALMTDFLMLNPLAYTIGKRYGIHSEAAIGLLFVPCGVGNMIGAPIAGRFSDAAIVRGRAKRNGVWVPEDRLHASLFGAGVLVPLSLLAFSLSLTFVPNQSLGITLIVLALFANGIGVDFVLTPVSAYLVDILHDRSAEAMAATGFLRGALVSLFISGILPAHDTFGMFATHVSVALFAWACFGLLLFTVRYGGAMRKAVDVGYSTAVVN